MSMLHVQAHASQTQTCGMDMDMQHGYRQYSMDMNMQHGDEHAPWTWNMQFGQGLAT
jgi:hypothetical protein